jgi:hypothetical protein
VKVATYIPITEEILADACLSGPPMSAILWDMLTKRWMSEFFGESWSTVRVELERLELGQPVSWDVAEVDDCW